MGGAPEFQCKLIAYNLANNLDFEGLIGYPQPVLQLPLSTQLNDVLVRDPVQNCWMHFRQPQATVSAGRVEDVLPALYELQERLEGRDLYAAGFVAYEAAPAFDPALKAKPPGSFPLLWFGIYDPPRLIPDRHLMRYRAADQLCLPAWRASITREDYDAAIARIKDYIARGDTYQVNYTYRLRTLFRGDPLAYFLELARVQNALYAAYIDLEDFTICSASPELFFRLDEDRLSSRPMKGTAARGLTQREDAAQAGWLRRSEKNRAENIMIVDMVRNDIGRIARLGSVAADDLFAVEKYPTVWQMVSTVSGETSAGLPDIFRALFPPASITGAPKPRTMEIIAELEPEARSIYTGCAGYIAPGRRAQFNVAIRTVCLDKRSGCAEYGVGGAITWDSLDSAEFDECQTKARILAVRLPDFCLLETILWAPGKGYFLLESHLQRLRDSAAYFSFPLDEPRVLGWLDGLSRDFGPYCYKVRLVVAEDGQVTAQAERLPEAPPDKVLRVCLAPGPVDPGDAFLYHKTTNREVYSRAMAARPGYDDVILWNDSGELTESCFANLVVELDGELVTPPVDCGLLPGTYRAWLLEKGQVKERVIPVADLDRCSRLFLVNSVRGQRQANIQDPPSALAHRSPGPAR